MACAHPDPKTVPWLFCRECGYWVNGVYVKTATDETLRDRLIQETRPVVDIIIYRTVNVTELSADRIENIRTCNGLLEPHEHAPDCPVRYGASADCVWPLAVCLAEPIMNVYNIDHSPASPRSPSENPPPPVASTTVVQATGICFRCGRNGLVPADGLWCSQCRNELGQD